MLLPHPHVPAQAPSKKTAGLLTTLLLPHFHLNFFKDLSISTSSSPSVSSTHSSPTSSQKLLSSSHLPLLWLLTRWSPPSHTLLDLSASFDPPNYFHFSFDVLPFCFGLPHLFRFSSTSLTILSQFSSAGAPHHHPLLNIRL